MLVDSLVVPDLLGGRQAPRRPCRILAQSVGRHQPVVIPSTIAFKQADPRARSLDQDPVLPPPPHTMSPLPQPKPTVILVPPPVILVPSVNPYACIQDGGNVFCRR